MARYLMSVHGADSDFDPGNGKFGGYASAEEAEAAMVATGIFNQKLVDTGHFVFAGGLRSASTATVVDATGDKTAFTDGPYLESKEWIGGFWIIEAPDLDIALALAAEAFLVAVTGWRDQLPPNPGGWLMTTATRKAIDRLRRESQREAKQADAFLRQAEPEPSHVIEDDQLRLVFTCCHPALAPEARLALTLRLVAGLTVEEIARALFASQAAVGQRITRAKAKIKAAHIPFTVPERLDERLPDVLAVVYLTFNEGYLPGSGPALRTGLSEAAERLARLLHAQLPDELEVTGLLALLLLTDARRAARVDETGALVTLDRQARPRQPVRPARCTAADSGRCSQPGCRHCGDRRGPRRPRRRRGAAPA